MSVIKHFGVGMNIGSNIATKMDGLTTVSAHPPVRGRRTRPDITFKQIRWQVWNDLATKDVQTSPTYSYQWMADQVGHMAVGMAVVLLFWPFGGIWPVIGFIAVVIGALLLELWDYWQACAQMGPPFNATRDREDLRQNAWIAVYYMALGGSFALSALMLDEFPTSLPVIVRVVVIFIVFAIAIGLPAFYWLRQKILFQQIGLPFLFRLPEFKLHGLHSGHSNRSALAKRRTPGRGALIVKRLRGHSRSLPLTALAEQAGCGATPENLSLCDVLNIEP